MRIILTGGGTGGHIFPLIAVARELKRMHPAGDALHLVYIGPDGFAEEPLKKEKITTRIVHAGKFRRYFTLRQILELLKLVLGCIESLWHLWWVMPDLIFSKGGYGSFWVVVWGWIFRIPIILHESDAIPGLTNRILGRFARKIFIAFEETEDYFTGKDVLLTGNPIREELLNNPRQEPRVYFNLTSTKPIVFVMGGSQGAERINNTVLEILPELIKFSEVIHQTGKIHIEDITKEVRIVLPENGRNFYHPYAFLDETGMNLAYRISALIVSRSGAGSIFEIAASGKPAILIPLASASANHQKENALRYCENGAGILLEEINLTPHLLLTQIQALIQNEKKQKEMSETAKAFIKFDAAKLIAQEISKFL